MTVVTGIGKYKPTLSLSSLFPMVGVEENTVQCALYLHLSIWMLYTDAGSDQAASGDMISRDVGTSTETLFFRQFCLLHQTALIVKRQLASLNPYWSHLAKMVNLWRILMYRCSGVAPAGWRGPHVTKWSRANDCPTIGDVQFSRQPPCIDT